MCKSSELIDLSQIKSVDISASLSKVNAALDKLPRSYGPPKDDNELTIKFFEWSNYEGEPLKFSNFSDFMDFLSMCNIDVDTELRISIYSKSQETGGAFIMCSHDGKKLFVERSAWALKYESEKYDRELKEKPSTVSSCNLPVKREVSPQYYGRNWWGEDDEDFGFYD